MKGIHAMIAVLLVVAALSGCVDKGVETNAVVEENATDDDVSNDAVISESLDDSEAEKLIPELPQITPKEPSDITINMNETVTHSGLCVNITYKGIDCAYRAQGGWIQSDAGEKIVKFYVTIEVIGNDTIETGLDDWQIVGEDGKTYESIPHDDLKPMRSSYQILSGASVDAYILFLIPEDMDDYIVQYDISDVVPGDCDTISWVVGDPVMPTASETFDTEVNMSTDENAEELFGYTIDWTKDPIEATYTGDPTVINTLFRQALQGEVRRGTLTEEEAEIVFEQCGGTGDLFEEVETEVPLTSTEGLTEFEVEPGEKEYYLIYYEAQIRPLSDEEQELFDGYAVQYSEDYMMQWVTSHMTYANEIAFAVSEGSKYTYVDGIWYVGERW